MVKENNRILVVDDEPMVREIAKEYLGGVGYDVTIAVDGADGIEVFKSSFDGGSPIALVIMDLSLPGEFGGKAAMAEMTLIDPAVKGVVSSGDPSNPEMVDCEANGFVAAIAKPYILSELKLLVDSLMG